MKPEASPVLFFPATALAPAILKGVASERTMTLSIETEQETDGRWIAAVEVLPGVMAYGTTKTDAVAKVQALALRVLADKLEHGEAVPELLSVSFQAA
jgi:predicted RNase H-like HicB family nuclease